MEQFREADHYVKHILGLRGVFDRCGLQQCAVGLSCAGQREGGAAIDY